MTIPSPLKRILIPAALLLLPWLVFLPSLDGTYVFDDLDGIVANEAVHDLNRVGDMVRFWIPSDVSYRPLRYLSYALDWNRSDGDPRAFHQTNLFSHGLGGAALWGLLLLILPDRRLAAWAALFWLVHPIQTEAVAYISGRKDLLASLFYFVALIGAVIRARSSTTRLRALSSAVFIGGAALSFLAKESALTLPVAALSLDVISRQGSTRARLGAALRDGRLFYGLILVAGGAALFYKLILAPGTKVAFDIFSDPITNLPDALRSYSLYLRKTLWPWPLIADLNGIFPVFLGKMSGWGIFWNGGTALATATGLSIGALLLIVGRGVRIVGAALAFYLLLALPVANLIPLNEPGAEHYAHLPLAALAIALTAATQALFERRKWPRHSGAILAGLCLIGLGSASFVRSNVWLDSGSLWTSVTDAHDGSDRAWSNLGLVYLETGQDDKATAAFQRALAIGQTPQPRIVANLMQSLRSRGDLAGALAAGRQGIAAVPDNPLLLSLVGATLIEMDRAVEALPLLDLLSSLPNADREAASGWRKDRALAYALTGDLANGERLLREAHDFDPTEPSILSSLGWLYMDQNRWVEADSILGLAVALPNASGNAWRNRAVALFRLGSVSEASSALDEAEKRGAQIPPSLRQAVTSQMKE